MPKSEYQKIVRRNQRLLAELEALKDRGRPVSPETLNRLLLKHGLVARQYSKEEVRSFVAGEKERGLPPPEPFLWFPSGGLASGNKRRR